MSIASYSPEDASRFLAQDPSPHQDPDSLDMAQQDEQLHSQIAQDGSAYDDDTQDAQIPMPRINLRPATNLERTKLTWGTIKDILFGLFLVFYAVSPDKPASTYGRVWIFAQIFLYGFNSKEMVRICFRALMSTWGLLMIVSGEGSLPEFVYVCINLNQFWTLVPFACIGLCSCLVVMGISVSIFCIKLGQFVSKQITDVIDRIRYHKQIKGICYSRVEEGADWECAICLQREGKMAVMECSHKFHPQCLEQWLSDHRTCPICRNTLY